MPRRLPDWFNRSIEYVLENAVGFKTGDGFHHLILPIRAEHIKARTPEKYAYLYSSLFSQQLIAPYMTAKFSMDEDARRIIGRPNDLYVVISRLGAEDVVVSSAFAHAFLTHGNTPFSNRRLRVSYPVLHELDENGNIVRRITVGGNIGKLLHKLMYTGYSTPNLIIPDESTRARVLENIRQISSIFVGGLMLSANESNLAYGNYIFNSMGIGRDVSNIPHG